MPTPAAGAAAARLLLPRSCPQPAQSLDLAHRVPTHSPLGRRGYCAPVRCSSDLCRKRRHQGPGCAARRCSVSQAAGGGRKRAGWHLAWAQLAGQHERQRMQSPCKMGRTGRHGRRCGVKMLSCREVCLVHGHQGSQGPARQEQRIAMPAVPSCFYRGARRVQARAAAAAGVSPFASGPPPAVWRAAAARHEVLFLERCRVPCPGKPAASHAPRARKHAGRPAPGPVAALPQPPTSASRYLARYVRSGATYSVN